MEKWISDNGDGTYTNPILYADYSDPDVIRVGRDYFMTASSFCNTPGLPILHSKDLVNWRVINYALPKIPFPKYDLPQHGCGVWAPAIRWRDGEFYLFYPMPDEGIFMTKTKDPWGEWSAPIALFQGAGWIDPCPFWDEDGRAYLVNAFAKSRIGFKSILQITQMSPDGTKLIGESWIVFDGNQNDQVTIEGPKLYKRNGYYYIFAPAGGVKQGWQTVLRAREIFGPYEYRVVCEQKGTRINGPHQGGLVDNGAGEEYFLHFQDVYAAGRIVHLQPLRWEEDWPVIGEAALGEICGKPVTRWKNPNPGAAERMDAPQVSDEFDGETLGLQWQWNANVQEGFYETAPERSALILRSMPKCASLADQPNLLLQKWAAPEFTAEAKCDLSGMEEGDLAGMVTLGVAYAALAVRRKNGRAEVIAISGRQEFAGGRARSCDQEELICGNICENEADGGQIYFRYHVVQMPPRQQNTEGKYAFPIPEQLIVMSYSTDGKNYIPAISLPAQAGRWVGVKEGLFICNENGRAGGSLQADYFRVS